MKIRHPLEQSLRGTIAVCDQGAEAMERGESEMLDGDGEWPRRPFVRGRKVNPVGCTLMAFFLLAFVFYLWVRISKTLDLAQYTWCAAELPATLNARCPLLVAPAVPSCAVLALPLFVHMNAHAATCGIGQQKLLTCVGIDTYWGWCSSGRFVNIGGFA